MFCFSCKYFDGSPVRRTVDSIKKFHPSEKIVIVDSMSDDKSYYDFFSDDDNVHILDDCNQHRVPGAFYQTLKHFPDEPYYINIQDSFIIKKSWQEYIDMDHQFISIGYFPDVTHSESRHEYQYMKKVFDGTPYTCPPPNSRFDACWGPVYIIKNSFAMELYDNGVLSNMKSTCKVDDETGERLFGIIAEAHGWSPERFNIEGDIITRWHEMVNDNLEYYTKIFGSRLGRK